MLQPFIEPILTLTEGRVVGSGTVGAACKLRSWTLNCDSIVFHSRNPNQCLQVHSMFADVFSNPVINSCSFSMFSVNSTQVNEWHLWPTCQQSTAKLLCPQLDMCRKPFSKQLMRRRTMVTTSLTAIQVHHLAQIAPVRVLSVPWHTEIVCQTCFYCPPIEQTKHVTCGWNVTVEDGFDLATIWWNVAIASHVAVDICCIHSILTFIVSSCLSFSWQCSFLYLILQQYIVAYAVSYT